MKKGSSHYEVPFSVTRDNVVELLYYVSPPPSYEGCSYG